MRLTAIYRPGSAGPVSEIAAQWVLRQEERELTSREQRRLENWLAENLDHVEAYEAAIWALDASARYSGESELKAMREAALAARGPQPKTPWLGLAGGGAIAASFLALWIMAAQPETSGLGPAPGPESATGPEAPDTYRTAIGERLAVTLPDGSVATLDTDSRIRVAYSDGERAIHLLRGQALFEVAQGKPLPFQVHARGQVITAVGTVFNVRLEADAVKVSLMEGRISVRANPDALAGTPSTTPPRPLLINAGESVEVRPRQPIAVKRDDVSRAGAWRHGQLVFNDTSVDEAVAEINRYTTRPIRIEDEAAGDHRVTGVFASSDPEHFSRALTEVLPLVAIREADGSTILKSRGE